MRDPIVTLRALAWMAAGSLLGASACSLVAGIGDLPFPESVGPEGGEGGPGPVDGRGLDEASDDGTDAGSPLDGAGDASSNAAGDASGDAAGDGSSDAAGDASSDGAGTTNDGGVDGADAPVALDAGPDGSVDAADEASSVPTGGDAGVEFIQHTGMQVSGPGSGGKLTLQLALPNVQAHDALIIAADFSSVTSPTTVPTVTDSFGNTFTMAVQPVGDSNGNWATLWYALDIKGGGSDTISLSTTEDGSGSYIEGYAQEYSGLVAFDGASSAVGTNLAMDSGPVTTTASGDLLFAFGSAGAVTAGPLPLMLRDATDSNATEDELTGAPGQYHATATQGGPVGATWLMVAAAFRTH